MSHIELPYEDLKQEMIKEISNHTFAFLATSENDYVRVGNNWIVSDGLTIYCFTFPKTRKYKQMKANPKVALAVDNLQVEGVATLKGHPQDEPRFLKAYKENQPELYERRSKTYFSRSETGTRVIEISPSRICRFKQSSRYKISESCFDVLDIKKKEAYSIKTMDLYYGRTPVYP